MHTGFVRGLNSLSAYLKTAPCPPNHPALHLSSFIPAVVAALLPFGGWLAAKVLKNSISTTLEGRQQATREWAREHWDSTEPVHDDRLDLSIGGITEIVLDYIELTNYAVSLVVLSFTYLSFIGQSVDLSVLVAWCLAVIIVLGGLVLVWAFHVPRGRLKDKIKVWRWVVVVGRLTDRRIPIAKVWVLRGTLAVLTIPSMGLILLNGG